MERYYLRSKKIRATYSAMAETLEERRRCGAQSNHLGSRARINDRHRADQNNWPVYQELHARCTVMTTSSAYHHIGSYYLNAFCCSDHKKSVRILPSNVSRVSALPRCTCPLSIVAFGRNAARLWQIIQLVDVPSVTPIASK